MSVQVRHGRHVRAAITEDEILGTLRHCNRCDEDWPFDEEFFYFDARRQVIGYCRACQSERSRDRYAASQRRGGSGEAA